MCLDWQWFEKRPLQECACEGFRSLKLVTAPLWISMIIGPTAVSVTSSFTPNEMCPWAGLCHWCFGGGDRCDRWISVKGMTKDAQRCPKIQSTHTKTVQNYQKLQSPPQVTSKKTTLRNKTTQHRCVQRMVEGITGVPRQVCKGEAASKLLKPHTIRTNIWYESRTE